MSVCRKSPRTHFGTPVYAGGIHLDNTTPISSITASPSGSVCEGTVPGIRYNESSSAWEFSNNGTVWGAIGVTSGSTGRSYKVNEFLSASIPINTNHTLPDSKTYVMGTGLYMDIYFNGQLLVCGTENDYSEINTTTIKFHFEVPVGTLLTYIV